jgi:hypothetical protein
METIKCTLGKEAARMKVNEYGSEYCLMAGIHINGVAALRYSIT